MSVRVVDWPTFSCLLRHLVFQLADRKYPDDHDKACDGYTAFCADDKIKKAAIFSLEQAVVRKQPKAV